MAQHIFKISSSCRLTMVFFLTHSVMSFRKVYFLLCLLCVVPPKCPWLLYNQKKITCVRYNEIIPSSCAYHYHEFLFKSRNLSTLSFINLSNECHFLPTTSFQKHLHTTVYNARSHPSIYWTSWFLNAKHVKLLQIFYCFLSSLKLSSMSKYYNLFSLILFPFLKKVYILNTWLEVCVYMCMCVYVERDIRL